MFKRYIAPCNAGGWRFMTLTVVTLWGSPLQFNVDKQNGPSVRRVLYQKQGDRMHQKVDDEVVFCMWCCFFVRRQASGVRKPPARAGLFRGGQVQGEAMASRL